MGTPEPAPPPAPAPPPLMERLRAQDEMPPATVKICRGRLISPTDYVIDVSEWGFADVVGKGVDEKHERPKH